MLALIHHGGGVGSPRGLLVHQVHEGFDRGIEPLAARHLAQPGGVALIHQRQPRQRVVGGGQRIVEQHTEVSKHLLGQGGFQDLHQVFGLDQHTRAVEFDHEAQRQLRDVAAQVVALALDAWRVESAAVGLPETEADPGHALGTVPAIGVQFPYHAVEVDPLVCERPAGDVAGGGQQLPETHRRLRSQPHRYRVAEIADGIFGSGATVEHRSRHEEVVTVGVAMHQGTERGQQHHVGSATGVLRHRGHPRSGVGGQPQRGARGTPTGRHTRSGWAGKFQRLWRIGHDRAPIVEVGLGSVGSGCGRRTVFWPQIGP
ncbi:Uncharacterised protein [Mycobacterium tuberculosis]|nr:Uncharacterised protein [Mycobacterium tuberculosis]CKS96562.1 Uncharacterised protein [Mycobacterium tuberculosis]CNU02553.1 Uncharacterised protein [Mycobacterium tuberculosis]CNU48027.1 Uncharacterised protein [Mycobacterium tuberculosis]CNU49108.1 Uncharacterised protein [Mycobacterium tuberculosis]